MRMPYIGGRGPDYTTKLNLMYNWRGAFRGGGVVAGDSWTGRERGGEGRRRPRRGRGTTLTQVSNVGRERHGQVETSLGGDTAGGGLKGDRKVIPLSDTQGRVIRRVQTSTSTPTIQTLPASANLPRKVATPLKRKGRLLEARGNRSPPRSESL